AGAILGRTDTDASSSVNCPPAVPGKAQATANDIGGGIGVEGAGAALGLAAVNLLQVVQGQAVVGDQVQVDGQGLPAAPQSLGQVALQGAIDAALQLGCPAR